MGNPISQISARDRFNLLCEKHKAKQQNELKAPGISPEINKLVRWLALDDLLERMAESNVSHEKTREEKKPIMKKRKPLEMK